MWVSSAWRVCRFVLRTGKTQPPRGGGSAAYPVDGLWTMGRTTTGMWTRHRRGRSARGGPIEQLAYASMARQHRGNGTDDPVERHGRDRIMQSLASLAARRRAPTRAANRDSPAVTSPRITPAVRSRNGPRHRIEGRSGQVRQLQPRDHSQRAQPEDACDGSRAEDPLQRPDERPPARWPRGGVCRIAWSSESVSASPVTEASATACAQRTGRPAEARSANWRVAVSRRPPERLAMAAGSTSVPTRPARRPHPRSSSTRPSCPGAVGPAGRP